MISVLFVCHGNICRSPMAAWIFRKLLDDNNLQSEFYVDSAATSTEELGNDIYPPAKACLRKHGINFEGHSARQIKKSDLEKFDFIICMEQYNIRNLVRLLGPSDKYKLLLDYTDIHGDIDDPWYNGNFETVYSQISEGCKGFLAFIEKNS